MLPVDNVGMNIWDIECPTDAHPLHWVGAVRLIQLPLSWLASNTVSARS